MINSCNCPDSAELAALINSAASILAKDRCTEEIEFMAIALDMLSDTLFSIAHMQKKQEHICRRCEEQRERQIERQKEQDSRK